MEWKPLGEGISAAEQALENALRQVSPWRNKGVEYCPVMGGISNSNWRIRVRGEQGTYFLKMPGAGTEMFIDRAAARQASKRAEEMGLGPATYDYLNHLDIEIHDFMETRRPCTQNDFCDPEIRREVIEAYRRFHSGPLLDLSKTIFDMIDEHMEQVRMLKGRVPSDFAWLDQQYRLARAAVFASGSDLAPSFNDPMPGNFMIDSRKTIMLIDYEYASNNERCYDLGIWSGENFFSEEIEKELIEAYFGRFDEQMMARLYIYKALADLKWGAWSMVQKEISALDFDYYKYGAWKYMRARYYMRHPDWPKYLKMV
jgi:thiamine kinase-like enzyme